MKWSNHKNWSDWKDRKENLRVGTIRYLRETHLTFKDMHAESERMDKLHHENGDQRWLKIVLVISNKIDFKLKTVKKD